MVSDAGHAGMTFPSHVHCMFPASPEHSQIVSVPYAHDTPAYWLQSPAGSVDAHTGELQVHVAPASPKGSPQVHETMADPASTA
jgi:hypothetical protein